MDLAFHTSRNFLDDNLAFKLWKDETKEIFSTWNIFTFQMGSQYFLSGFETISEYFNSLILNRKSLSTYSNKIMHVSFIIAEFWTELKSYLQDYAT